MGKFLHRKQNRISAKPTPYVSEMKKTRQKAYNSTKWRRLRAAIYMQYPCCVLCEKENKTTPTQHIHHIITPFKDDGDVDMGLLLNPNNCLAVCEYHHGKIHGEGKEADLYDIYYNRENNLEDEYGEDETIHKVQG